VYKFHESEIREGELAFYLGNTKFLIRKSDDLLSPKKIVNKGKQLTNLTPILNAIDFKIQITDSRLSPVIYTGMTN
jgi:hypothetical protein